jgi:hypothetical protein
MAQFASIWAVQIKRGPNDTAPPHHEGDTIQVSLKSGASKPVKLSKFLYSTERKDGMKSDYWLSEKTD